MSKTLQLIPVYVVLRPKTLDLPKVWESIQEITNKYQFVQSSLAGIGYDSHLAHISIGFSTPVSDQSLQAISTLKCIHEIFTSLYQCMPCYSAEPSALEKRSAGVFLEQIAISKVTLEGQKAYV